MKDKVFGMILLGVAILLLCFTLYVNISGILGSLNDPLAGDGFGALCFNEEDCRNFCQNNNGLCRDYCNDNPQNELCDKFFGSGR